MSTMPAGSARERGVWPRRSADPLEERRERRTRRTRQPHREEVLRTADPCELERSGEDLARQLLELGLDRGERRVDVGGEEAVIDSEKELGRSEAKLSGQDRIALQQGG